ncbi:V4R domain-containing protein [Paracoccus fontiphilus]|uniref:V4R domain-containing protein n=1 Tax=Paracoccus fontiphilus TaxID=1815556 RepID=A0ABV7IEI4_9RHOB|nr:V4R domain-containing protein [Paracoccus fontiphilus]
MTFRDRLHYDAGAGTYHDSSMRYIFIKPEAFMGVALEMPADQRPAVFEAMIRTVIRNGGKSAQAYKAAGAADPGALLAVIRETAGQLGWGRWESDLGPDRLTVTVHGSPFAAGYGASDLPVCAPITGMLTAVSGMIFDAPTVVRERECAATGAPACVFEACPA